MRTSESTRQYQCWCPGEDSTMIVGPGRPFKSMGTFPSNSHQNTYAPLTAVLSALGDSKRAGAK
ncbi:MAG: hypothetical protein ACRD8W_00400 [Nitrososphaeraceae archaeon]